MRWQTCLYCQPPQAFIVLGIPSVRMHPLPEILSDWSSGAAFGLIDKACMMTTASQQLYRNTTGIVRLLAWTTLVSQSDPVEE